jgi:hypothetical protein
MEVHSLKLLVTEEDLVQLAIQAAKDQEQLSDVKVRITPLHVSVSGSYQVMMRVPFETTWQVVIRDGKVAATLAELKVVGLPAGLLKGVLMRMVADEAAREPALAVEGDTIVFDPDRFLAGAGIVGRANLTLIRCELGRLFLEGGSVV